MAKSDPTTTENNAPQDIGTIREILMGAYIREYAASFDALRARMDATDESTESRLLKMETDINQRIIALEQSLNQRLRELEGRMDESIKRVEEAFQQAERGQKQKLSQLFNLLSSQINE